MLPAKASDNTWNQWAKELMNDLGLSAPAFAYLRIVIGLHSGVDRARVGWQLHKWNPGVVDGGIGEPCTIW